METSDVIQGGCCLDLPAHEPCRASPTLLQLTIRMGAWGALGGAGFCGWFDVHFRGSEESPCDPVTLSTAPAAGYTHWGHTVLPVSPFRVQIGSKVVGEIQVDQKPANPRKLNVRLQHRLADGHGRGGKAEDAKCRWSMD
jgi:hypothetical protein